MTHSVTLQALAERCTRLPMTPEVQAQVLLGLAGIYSLIPPDERGRMDPMLRAVGETTAALVKEIEGNIHGDHVAPADHP